MPKHLHLLLLAAAISSLTACGGSSSDSSDDTAEEEHEHAQRFLYSDNNASDLMVFDHSEEAFELVGQASEVATQLIKSDDGLTAAVISSTGVQFVDGGVEEHDESETTTEEEHEEASLLDLTITRDDPQVVMTANHYAVLNNGNTDFYPASTLADATGAEEDISIEGYTQTAPALILDEEHGLYALFDGDSVDVYEGTEATDVSFDCADLGTVVHSGSLALIQCGSTVNYLLLQEDETSEEAVVNYGNSGITGTVLGMQAAGGLGLVYTSEMAYVVHGHDDHVHAEDSGLILEDGQQICLASMNPTGGYLLAIRDDATGAVIDLAEEDATATVSITLTDATDNFSCDNLTVGAADEAFMVADSDSGSLYVIDAHEGGAFHLHGVEALPDNTNISSAVLLSASEAETDHVH